MWKPAGVQLEGCWRSRRHHPHLCSQLPGKSPCQRGGADADGAVAVEALRVELIRAKERGRCYC